MRVFHKFLVWVIILYSLGIIYLPRIMAHGPDQVDHNFYLEPDANKIMLRWEIPAGEILGFNLLQKMDTDKDGKISNEEQEKFLKKFTEEHLQNVEIVFNGQKNIFSYSHTTINLVTDKVMPSPITITIFFQASLIKETSRDFSFYLKDQADLGITQFISLYTHPSIQNVKIEKELINGEERIFKLSFSIAGGGDYSTGKEQLQGRKPSIPGLYEKVKVYLTIPNIPLKISILLFCFATLLGILHALEPGHGKSIMTAYILASRGTVVDVILLGTIVVITHTTLVVLLGLITLYLSEYILPHTIYPYLSFISSLLIIILGLTLIRRNAIMNKMNHHIHTTNIGHSSLKDIIQIGISGGLVPCPAAIAILLTAVQLNKIAIGILLIIALGVGIAITLISIGVIAVYTKKFIFDDSHSLKVTSLLPIISGVFITTLGTIMLFKFFEQVRIFRITL